MNKIVLASGAILGVLAVILGAFAAHGLKQLVPAESITSFETGVRYQMYHAFLLLFLGSTSFLSHNSKKLIYSLVLAGVILFSGSIYGLATDTLTTFNFKSIALITPIGGVLLILGWLVMLVNILKIKNE